MRHLAHFYSSTSLPAIFRCPKRRMRNISVCLLLVARVVAIVIIIIIKQHHLVISSSSPSSYSQLNVHFSVKQAVKWHFRCRSSRCFVSFAWLACFVWPSARLAVWSLVCFELRSLFVCSIKLNYLLHKPSHSPRYRPRPRPLSSLQKPTSCAAKC